ncbi:sensor histidine kinase [Fodinibius saliphilus]|uniref:sensor histidine kinase n=1 Tax=Fodinibius saliphilus TaxID=1920650 RepID=UPI001BB23B96|nr:histidine kinase dimerization/phosphoacceptor domain -containing protein [Fodinibius saliphilus]
MAKDVFEEFREKQLTKDVSQSVDQRIAKTLIKAIETTKEMVVVTDAPETIGEEKIVFVNSAFEKVTQYSKEEILGKSPTILQGPKTNQETIKDLVEKVSNGEHFEGETFNYKKDGSTYRVRWSIDPIRDDEGEITHFVSVQRDVTKEWEQQQKLKEIIDEREMLIKETHHRIKNNLATITGMLELQIIKSNSEDVQEVLSESMNRVQSIASIHEKLYKTEGLASIALNVYIEDLIEHLQNSMETINSSGPGKIGFDLEIEPISLNMRKAVPLGLIINELVSNAHKHAFEDNGGTVSIRCYEEDDHLFLKVTDNGKGIPDNMDIQENDSLGLKLIETLTQQIDAEYRLYSENGTHFEMNFKKDA